MEPTLEDEPTLETPPSSLFGISTEALALSSMDADGMMGRWLSESGLYGYDAEPVLFPQPAWSIHNGYNLQSNWLPGSEFFGQPLNTPLEVKAMKAYHTQPVTTGISTTAIAPSIATASSSLQSLPAPLPPLQPKQDVSYPSNPLEILLDEPTSPNASSSGRSHATPNATRDLPSEDDDDLAATMAMEKDGMIWGMKVADYRALSAKDRKRTRNRISARHFRLRRKRHFDNLAKDLGDKDEILEKATQEAASLKKEVATLRRKIAMYEGVEVKPEV